VRTTLQKLPSLLRGASVALALMAVAGVAGAQDVGVLLSPGELSQAHAKLTGMANCQKCHEPGK